MGALRAPIPESMPPVSACEIARCATHLRGNIWGRNHDVTYIGYGKSSLDAVVEKRAAEQGRTVKGDQFPDRGFLLPLRPVQPCQDRPRGLPRHRHRLRRSSPRLGREQIEAWEAVHYHQPSDHLTDEWSFDGMIDDAVLGFKIGLWLAEQDEMPSWNPGDEFEAARQQALAALGGTE